MMATGFRDVRAQHKVWPIGDWQGDLSHRGLGTLAERHAHSGLQNWAMRRFTRYLPWEREEIVVLCARVGNELRRPEVHAVQNVKVVYGVKSCCFPGERQNRILWTTSAVEVQSLSLTYHTHNFRQAPSDEYWVCFEGIKVYRQSFES